MWSLIILVIVKIISEIQNRPIEEIKEIDANEYEEIELKTKIENLEEELEICKFRLEQDKLAFNGYIKLLREKSEKLTASEFKQYFDEGFEF